MYEQILTKRLNLDYSLYKHGKFEKVKMNTPGLPAS